VDDLGNTVQPFSNSTLSYDVAKNSAQRLESEIQSLKNIFSDMSLEATSFNFATFEVYLIQSLN